MKSPRAVGRRILLCCLYLAAACTTWRTIPPSASPTSAPRSEYDRVRVTDGAGKRIELRRARLDRDSISGYAGKRHSRRHVSMAVGDVARVESLEPDVARTLLLIATPLALLVAAAVSW